MKKTIIIIVIVLIIGIGGYYFTTNRSSNVSPVYTPPVSNNQNTDTSVPTVTPTNPVSNTSITPESSNIVVNIKNFSFSPTSLTIKTGTKVTWINNDSVAHTVTSNSGSLLNSPTLSPGQSFSFTFSKTGVENYYCVIHPVMKGQIIVTN